MCILAILIFFKRCNFSSVGPEEHNVYFGHVNVFKDAFIFMYMLSLTFRHRFSFLRLSRGTKYVTLCK